MLLLLFLLPLPLPWHDCLRMVHKRIEKRVKRGNGGARLPPTPTSPCSLADPSPVLKPELEAFSWISLHHAYACFLIWGYLKFKLELTRGQKSGNLTLFGGFDFFSCAICLLLFPFQSPQVSVPCVLSRFYNYIPGVGVGGQDEMFLLHLTWNQKLNRHSLKLCLHFQRIKIVDCLH